MDDAQIQKQGDLSETSLPSLLLELSLSGFSGELRLTRERTKKAIQFQKGAPVASESNLASEQLGVQLLDAGHITQADHARISEYIAAKSCKEGVALIALELLEPKQLFLALKDQVRQRVVSCFAWPRGHFEVEEEQAAARRVQPFRCDLFALVQEGLATHWGPERMFQDLGESLSKYAVPSPTYLALSRKQPFGEHVETLVAALDGSVRFAEAMGARGNEPAILAAAWLLSQHSLLRLSDAPTSADEEADEQVQMPEIEISVDAEPAAVRVAKKTRAESRTAEEDDARSQRAQQMREEIEQKLAHLDKFEHYAVLGVEADADAAVIKRAYLTAAKRYHPDALARIDLQDMKAQASEVFARIAEAYEVLSNSDKRRHYDDSLLDDGHEIDAAVLAQAETFYRKGEILLGMGNFRDALAYLKNAVDVWPDENAYQSDLGWAYYKKRPSDPESARTHLEKALELDPGDAVGHFRLGLVMRALGDADRANEQLERAKTLDPQIG